jgi:hypothetical protein
MGAGTAAGEKEISSMGVDPMPVKPNPLEENTTEVIKLPAGATKLRNSAGGENATLPETEPRRFIPS